MNGARKGVGVSVIQTLRLSWGFMVLHLAVSRVVTVVSINKALRRGGRGGGRIVVQVVPRGM